MAGIAFILTLLVMVPVIYAVAAKMKAAASLSPGVIDDNKPADLQGRRPDALPVVVVGIHPGRFEPTDITIPKGRFLLAVYNRSGLDTLTYRLEKVGGNRLKEVGVRGSRQRWKETFDLSPGEYRLSVSEDPTITMTINVTSR